MSKEDERKYFCGPSNVPQWLTKWFSNSHNEACRIHDVDYSTKRISRKEADKQFLDNMLEKADTRGKKNSAYLYYGLVRLFGGRRYGKK